MKYVLYLLFVSVILFDYFHFRLNLVPRYVTWTPELLSLFTCYIIAVYLSKRRKFYMQMKYIYLLLIYFTIVIIGVVLNSTPTGTVIIGLRFYLKVLPFFLIPAIVEFSEDQFKKQLLFILPFLLFQSPLALYQRLFKYSGDPSGDLIKGTFTVSSALSIMMICAIAVVLGFYLKKRISKKTFILLSFCLFLPTTVNETKGTLVLLPLALLLPSLMCEGLLSSIRIKNLFTTALLGVLFVCLFVPIYDHFMRPRTGYGIIDFFLEERFKGYIYRGATQDDLEKVGRADSLILSFSDLSANLPKLLFGLGIGNVGHSYFDSLKGDHTDKQKYGANKLALSHMLWETGLAGVIVYITFLFFIFRDALLVKECKDIFGSFALGWSAVVIIVGICLLYKNILNFNALNFLFWYFSGVMAVRASKLKLEHENYALTREQSYSYSTL